MHQTHNNFYQVHSHIFQNRRNDDGICNSEGRNDNAGSGGHGRNFRDVNCNCNDHKIRDKDSAILSPLNHLTGI